MACKPIIPQSTVHPSAIHRSHLLQIHSCGCLQMPCMPFTNTRARPQKRVKLALPSARMGEEEGGVVSIVLSIANRCFPLCLPGTRACRGSTWAQRSKSHGTCPIPLCFCTRVRSTCSQKDTRYVDWTQCCNAITALTNNVKRTTLHATPPTSCCVSCLPEWLPAPLPCSRIPLEVAV